MGLLKGAIIISVFLDENTFLLVSFIDLLIFLERARISPIKSM